MTGHGSKFGRKKEQAIAALLSHRNLEESAKGHTHHSPLGFRAFALAAAAFFARGGAFPGRHGLKAPFAADRPAAFSTLSSSVLEELQHVRRKLLGRDHARSAAGGSGRIRE